MGNMYIFILIGKFCKKLEMKYNASLKRQLIIAFCLVIVPTIVMISIVNYRRNVQYTEKETIDHKFDILRNQISEIDFDFHMIEKISDQLLVNNYVQEAVSERINFNNDYELMLFHRKINSILSGFTELFKIQSVGIIGTNGMIYQSGDELLKIGLQDLSKTNMYLRIIEAKGLNIWYPSSTNIFLYNNDQRYSIPCIYVARQMRNLDNVKKYLGFSFMQIKGDMFYKILIRGISENGARSLLVSKIGEVLADTDNIGNIGKKIDKNLLGSIVENSEDKNDNKGAFHYNEDGVEYLILIVPGENSENYIVHYIPYENIVAQSRSIRNFTLLLMLIGVTIATALSFVIAKNMTLPIVRLKDVMDAFATGNLECRSQIGRKDEIGQLQNGFNDMAENINRLLARVDEENKKQRQLEFKMLEYQINPHFLYNTLDSINWMAQKGEKKEISRMVTALSRFFRISLSKGKEIIKIKDELDHVRNYLTIYSMRFKSSFEYSFDIDEELLEHNTIKLILQPVVENSIKYGIDKSNNDNLIQVKCNKIEGDIVFEISDNGCGIVSERLFAIRRELISDYGTTENEFGIGLLNINQRIKLKYGNNYGVSIDSTLNIGTTVYIRIPASA